MGGILLFHNAICMGLDIFCVMVEILAYCASVNELHVLEIEKVYRKYILDMLIDNIMDYWGGNINQNKNFTWFIILQT